MEKAFRLIVFFILLIAASFCAYSSDRDAATQHYRVGRIYYEHGLYKEAEREFKRALQILNREEKIAQAAGVAVVEKRKEEQEEVTPPPSVPRKTGDYIIGQGDTLFVTVWENPDLNQEVIVRPDGKISFPLVDEVQASGLTILELDNAITERLKKYIRFPDVSISLRKIAAGRVIVLGQVDFPGVYSVTAGTTALEVIALAGGFTSDSIASSTIVIKGGLDRPQAERINLNEAIHSPSSQQNITLASGDIIFVPKKFIADMNYFLTTLLEPLLDSTLKAQEFSRGAKRW